MVRDEIIEELNRIPEQKMYELYDLIHYFRLGLEGAQTQKAVGRGAGDMVGRLLDHPVQVTDASPLGREELHVR